MGRKAAVACSLSQTLQEGDDDETFFFQAPHLAVRERMAQLKDRWRPLAIVLSSNASNAENADNKGASEAKADETLRSA